MNNDFSGSQTWLSDDEYQKFSNLSETDGHITGEFSPPPPPVNPNTGKQEAPQCIIRNFRYGPDGKGISIELNFYRSVLDVKNSCGFDWIGVHENQPLRAVVQSEYTGDWFSPGHPPKPIARADSSYFNYGYQNPGSMGAIYLIAFWLYVPLQKGPTTFTVQMMIGNYKIPFSHEANSHGRKYDVDEYGRLIFNHIF